MTAQGFAAFEYPSNAPVENGLEYPYGYTYTPIDQPKEESSPVGES